MRHDIDPIGSTKFIVETYDAGDYGQVVECRVELGGEAPRTLFQMELDSIGVPREFAPRESWSETGPVNISWSESVGTSTPDSTGTIIGESTSRSWSDSVGHSTSTTKSESDE